MLQIGETIQDKAIGMEIVKYFFLCYVCVAKDKCRIIRELIADTKIRHNSICWKPDQKMNLKSPSIRDHLQTSGDRDSIRDLLLCPSGHFIAEDTIKKSKIIE